MDSSRGEDIDPDAQDQDEPIPLVIPYGPMYRPFRREVFVDPILIAFMMLLLSLQYWNHSLVLPFEKESARWWISLVAVFIHADLGHFLSNMILFIPFASLLESHYGRVTFPWIGLLIGYITHLIVLTIEGPGYGLIGASGMVYGLGGLWLGLFILHGNRFQFRQRILRSVGVMLILLFPSQFMPEVSYLAHGIGFIVGLCFVPLVGRIANGSNTLYLPQMIWRPRVSLTMSDSEILKS